MNFKLIQLGYTTFGTGETIESAREDSREWMDNPADADDVKYAGSFSDAKAFNHGELIIVEDDVASELGEY